MNTIRFWGLTLALIFATTFGFSQKHGRIGLSVNASALSGSEGFIFDVPNQLPHREFGLGAGVYLYAPLQRDLHLLIGALGQYEVAHFHINDPTSGDLTDGEFRYGYLQVPILLNHSGISVGQGGVVLKEYFGVALNFDNQLDPVQGTLEGENLSWPYRTEVRQTFDFNPEFVVGVGLISRPTAVGRFHYQAGLHIDMIPGQEYIAQITPTGEAPVVQSRTFRGIKGVFSVIWFPQINIRRKACYR